MTASVVKILRVTVALDDLGGHPFRAESELSANVFLHVGLDEGKGPHGPRHLPAGYRVPRTDEPLAVPGHLFVPHGHLQSEGDRLGMNAVGSPDHEGRLVPDGLLFQDGQQFVDVGKKDFRGLLQEHGQGCVEDVRRREPHVDEPGIGPDEFGNAGQEGNDVVLHGPLDFVDSIDVETGLRLDRLERLPGDVPSFRQGLADENLDVQPLLEAVLRTPDGFHFLARIPRDHDTSVQGLI